MPLPTPSLQPATAKSGSISTALRSNGSITPAAQTPVTLQGATGLQWEEYLNAPAGLQWEQSLNGPTSLNAPAGLQWEENLNGPTSLNAPAGLQWEQNLNGPTALNGPTSLNGATGLEDSGAFGDIFTPVSLQGAAGFGNFSNVSVQGASSIQGASGLAPASLQSAAELGGGGKVGGANSTPRPRQAPGFRWINFGFPVEGNIEIERVESFDDGGNPNDPVFTTCKADINDHKWVPGFLSGNYGAPSYDSMSVFLPGGSNPVMVEERLDLDITDRRYENGTVSYDDEGHVNGFTATSFSEDCEVAFDYPDQAGEVLAVESSIIQLPADRLLLLGPHAGATKYVKSLVVFYQLEPDPEPVDNSPKYLT